MFQPSGHDQFAALMVLLGMISFGGLTQSLRRRTSRLISELIGFRTRPSECVAFPLIKYVYNTKARCYLNIFPHFQILSHRPPCLLQQTETRPWQNLFSKISIIILALEPWQPLELCSQNFQNSFRKGNPLSPNLLSHFSCIFSRDHPLQT